MPHRPPQSPLRALPALPTLLSRAATFLALAFAFTAASSVPSARAAIDENNDGINDVWAARHGGNLPPAADPDGDGIPNAAEAAAGTDPRDSASRFSVRTLDFPAANRARLRWPSVPGKFYRVQASADLTTWTTLNVSAEGDGTELSVDLPLDRTYAGGDFTLSRWEDLSSSTWMWAFKNLIAAGTPAATRTFRVPTLSTSQTDPDLERFGQYARGWIVPPADGQYRFFLAGDDTAEFWLSPSAEPTGKQRVSFVPGWTYPGEWTKHPEQTSALLTLQGGRPHYFELYHIEGTTLDHVTVAWTGPTLNPDKEPLAARYYASDPRPLSETFASSGGRAFYRVSVEDLDRDGDGLSDHDELFLGSDPLDSTTQPRVADRDAALGRLSARNRLTLGSASPRAYETGALPARVTVFRSGNLDPVTVRYSVSGNATAGADYAALSGVITLPAGASRIEFPITPVPDAFVETPETITLALLRDDAAFDLGTPAQVSLTIDDAPDELFLAALRPPTGLGSGAWGSAALLAAGNGLSSRVSLSYSALLGPATGAELFISSSGTSGPVVLGLAAGQVSARAWDLAPAAGQSHDAILAALREGRLWVRVSSSSAPTGELFGQLLPATGAEASPAPPAPPALPTTPPAPAEAHRFLEQAAFGASPSAVATVRTQGYAAWLAAQRIATPTYLLPQFLTRRAEFLARNLGDGWQTPFQESWWQTALTAPDQLRQRVAWALSQILVASQEGALAGEHEAATAYYDLLLSHALGNYRDLLEDVTKSPVMGTYLSMMRNRRPDPETGQRPDENYAREVMQLFSIGLNELHPDGTLRLDANGLPVPTYTQADIVGLAHVFTGWGPHYDDANPPRWSNGAIADRTAWFLYGYDVSRPMSFYPEYHDLGAKRIVRGFTIPAGIDGNVAMDTALDTLFNHPNVGPFLGRQLIQRLVTSNPSPGYVARVAAAFANNGSGQRGDLFATVRAVLLDPEARLAAPNAAFSAGKRAEPVLRLTRLYHVFPPTPPRAGDPRYFINYQYDLAHQVPMGSPSVFNFFQPGYAHPGAIATAGLVSPEFQITSETTVIGESNRFHDILNWGKWTAESSIPTDPSSPALVLTLPLDAELAILARTPTTPAENFSALVTHLADKLRGGRVSSALRTELAEFHAALPSWYWATTDATLLRDRRLPVIRYAIHLIAIAPETAIDR